MDNNCCIFLTWCIGRVKVSDHQFKITLHSTYFRLLQLSFNIVHKVYIYSHENYVYPELYVFKLYTCQFSTKCLKSFRDTRRLECLNLLNIVCWVTVNLHKNSIEHNYNEIVLQVHEKVLMILGSINLSSK